MSAVYTRPKRLLAPIASTTGKVQWAGMVILGGIILAALAAPLLSPYGPSQSVCDPFQMPGADHPLGCDDAGHDLWAQLLYGARVSLFVGLAVAAVATSVAVAIAIVAGLAGGWGDRLIMRCVDVVLSLPFLPLVIVLGVFLGASLSTQIVVIALVMWAQPVRELRSQILSVRALGFVEAARAMGASAPQIGARHILPEIAPLIVPQFVRIAHNAILVETSLSFLGLGDPLQTSWGTILYHANARTAFLTGSWLWWIVPAGLAVAITVTALAFVGFGFDAALGPQTGRRRGAVAAPNSPADPQAALSIRDLRVVFRNDTGETMAVRDVSLDLGRGELLGLVGESGSGKTTTAMAVLGLLRPQARVARGAISLRGTDLLALPEAAMRGLRGRRIALIPQSAMNALNPVLSIGDQMGETLIRTAGLDRAAAEARVGVWLARVGLAPEHAGSYAHQLSGGMRQRAVIALALCTEPEVVIADEPTTGLDVLVQEEIMALLLDLRASLNLSVLFVTHNLPLIARHADRLAVMYHGAIVDQGNLAELRAGACHAHTRDLFTSLPQLDEPKRWPESAGQGAPLMALEHVSKRFQSRGILGRGQGRAALEDVSLELRAGERLGLVGGSGAGKSTITRLLMGLIAPDAGRVLYEGQAINGAADRARLAQAVHLVFQDPYGSMRNSMSIRDVVAEPLRIHGETDQAVIAAKVEEALAAVHLPPDRAFQSRLPVALSGGQRQRVAFARAIVTRPRIIIADEPTSMLDQSVRMEIMGVLEDLRVKFGTSVLFVTHDIALARHFCDRIVVLQSGRVVEEGPADQLIRDPRDAYTRKLIAAA
ncbi:MAG: nickel ABC transporter ATP-binding protein NikE [Qingshengfaniella sp.]